MSSLEEQYYRTYHRNSPIELFPILFKHSPKIPPEAEVIKLISSGGEFLTDSAFFYEFSAVTHLNTDFASPRSSGPEIFE